MAQEFLDARRSALPSNRWVAKLWRRPWGVRPGRARPAAPTWPPPGPPPGGQAAPPGIDEQGGLLTGAVLRKELLPQGEIGRQGAFSRIAQKGQAFLAALPQTRSTPFTRSISPRLSPASSDRRRPPP